MTGALLLFAAATLPVGASFGGSPLRAEAEAATRQTIVSKVSAGGTVGFIHTDAVYPCVQAKIVRINVQEGDKVIAGDLLLEYDETAAESLRDQLADAELLLKSAQINLQAAQLPASAAEKMQAEANVNQARKAEKDILSQMDQLDISVNQLKRSRESAQKRYDDAKILYDNGVIAKGELDTIHEDLQRIGDEIDSSQTRKNTLLMDVPAAAENLRVAQEQYESISNRFGDPKVQNQISALQVVVDQANLKIEKIQKQIAGFKTREVSDFNGTVIGVYVKEGDVSAVGKALLEIADTSPRNLVVKIDVPEEDAKNLDVGQEAHITGAALGGAIYRGRVSKIYPMAEKRQMGSDTQTVITAEITPADEDVKLRAGYSIDTDIITKITIDAVVIPQASVAEDSDGTHFVYICRNDGMVEKKQVRLGECIGTYVQADGLKEGEKVIVNPSPQIKEGLYIKPNA
jgi:HlyD family secretion protein